ncbi:hypothetical protein RJ639_000908 [Escallonia herrerae]|uniref:Knottins-like domain-containing protein n=1 Tax=Escallonia herrerae TaxID=1293975 RepID=A0AA88XAJ5_9ASTE|nr:hypothetical protein RJ639_000908 [Escallonia herrerae]
MEMKRLFGLIMLLLILLASRTWVALLPYSLSLRVCTFKYVQEASKTGVEARSCELRMHGLKGRCLTDHDCGLVCRREGFSTGQCQGLRRHCFCTRC